MTLVVVVCVCNIKVIRILWSPEWYFHCYIAFIIYTFVFHNIIRCQKVSIYERISQFSEWIFSCLLITHTYTHVTTNNILFNLVLLCENGAYITFWHNFKETVDYRHTFTWFYYYFVYFFFFFRYDNTHTHKFLYNS